MKDEVKTRAQLIEELEVLRQKVAQLETPEDEFKCAVILDHHPAHAVLQDLEHRIMWANRAACESLNLSREQVVGRYCYTLWGQRTTPCPNCPIEKTYRTGTAEEGYIQTPDGRQWHVYSRPIMNESGNIKQILEITEDVTEQEGIARAWRTSEARLRRAEIVAQTGHWEIDMQANTVFASSGARRIYGVEGTTWTLARVQSIPLLEYRATLDQALRDLIDAEIPYDVTFKIQRPSDGQIRDIHSVAEYDAQRHVVFGIIQDITKQKKVEADLAKYNQLFEAVIKYAPFAAHVVDGDFNNIRVIIENEESRRIMGETVEGRKGIDAAHPESLQCRFFTLDGLTEVPLAEMPSPRALQGDVVKNEPYLFRHPDGTEIIAETNAIPMYDDAGNIMAVVVTFYDITDLMRTEAQLKISLEEKQVLLQELYHRTKNNLQVIYSMLVVYAQQFTEGQVIETFKEIGNRIQSMALAQQKLYESQNLSRINLKDYVMDLVVILVQSYPMSSARVSLVTDMEDVYTLIDTAAPCGLLLNELLSNALKYAFPDPMRGEIRIQLRRDPEGHIVFSVTDNGVGVPAGFDFRQCETLGIQNIISIVEHQLRGEIEFDVEGGVTCHVRFKDNLYQERV